MASYNGFYDQSGTGQSGSGSSGSTSGTSATSGSASGNTSNYGGWGQQAGSNGQWGQGSTPTNITGGGQAASDIYTQSMNQFVQPGVQSYKGANDQYANWSGANGAQAQADQWNAFSNNGAFKATNDYAMRAQQAQSNAMGLSNSGAGVVAEQQIAQKNAYGAMQDQIRNSAGAAGMAMGYNQLGTNVAKELAESQQGAGNAQQQHEDYLKSLEVQKQIASQQSNTSLAGAGIGFLGKALSFL